MWRKFRRSSPANIAFKDKDDFAQFAVMRTLLMGKTSTENLVCDFYREYYGDNRLKKNKAKTSLLVTDPSSPVFEMADPYSLDGVHAFEESLLVDRPEIASQMQLNWAPPSVAEMLARGVKLK